MIQTHADHPSLLNLPTELFHAILNHLSDDKSSLRSCCLASRAFLPTAQALLFRRVELRASAWGLHGKNPELDAGIKLRHLVEASHLLSHTRELDINGRGIVNEYRLGRDPALVPALEAFISLKNSHITADSRSALQCISLRSINMSSPDLLNATIQRLLALESITHIRIRGGNMPLNIFKHFPSRVKILELSPMTFRNSAAATAQVADGYPKLVNLPAIRLESLVIWGPSNPYHNSSEVIFNNPNRGCDGASIRTLHLGYLYTHELGMYGTFAPHVEKLTVELKDEQAYTPIDFSQFSRLQYFYISRIDIDRQIRWLARSLRHVKTDNSFRSITLNYVNDQSLNMVAWAELDSVLAGSQFESESFSGMTIVVSYLHTDYYSLLPRTIDKKLLKVDAKY
ncbi:hypothetical protein M378DRAFT_749549 [Amanita muscaria Koide BX008]|uniref:F-box domain-containing protein n=1 Tax=Amanita muscaria (strain Koide BX008) TaxID=946122 RepID=A0A0C2X1Z9_AMAMK|nr:hypothetical protein M378DRAFT_749549 [Amanita muscaria Koide BX008]